MRESNVAEELGISENTDYKSRKDVEELFKNRQEDMIGLLKEGIADIQQLIASREELHNELVSNLDKIELFIDNSMPKVDSGNDADLIKELLKKKIEAQEIKLQEKLNFWRDVSSLKKELREHMKEYRDMESKTSMIDNILED